MWRWGPIGFATVRRRLADLCYASSAHQSQDYGLPVSGFSEKTDDRWGDPFPYLGKTDEAAFDSEPRHPTDGYGSNRQFRTASAILSGVFGAEFV